MTDFVVTDGLLRAALAPAAPSLSVAELGATVSERIRRAPQRRRRFALPWATSPAATLQDYQRARLLRLAIAVMLMAATVGIVAAGAQLLPPPDAPPQWLLLQNGQSMTVPIGGGDRTALPAFAGMVIEDISTSWDGNRLATIRGQRSEILEIWDARAVFANRPTEPIRYELPGGVRMYDAGVWRRDGSGILFGGSDHGVSRVFLLDLATREVSQLTPDGVNVDDWQHSPNDQWLEVIGQRAGRYGLYVLEIETRELRPVLLSDGVDIPVPGALGWSPDSLEMAVLIEHDATHYGIWVLRPDGGGLRRITPEGQQPDWAVWSPDGAWIMYHAPDVDQGCRTSTMPGTLRDTWLVRPDGTDGRMVARAALPVDWSDDSRSVLLESQLARSDAPLGGVIRVFVDGSPPELVYAYTSVDRSPNERCHPYGVLTKRYRGMSTRP